MNCLPLKAKKCTNTLSSHADFVSDSSDTSVERVIQNGGARGDHVSLTASDCRSDLCRNSSVDIDTCNISLLCNESQASVQQPSRDRVDDLMRMAYGETLLYSDGGPRHSSWCQRWSDAVQHLGRHYSLPGGSIGKKYINLLNDELLHLISGSYSSERVILFCSVMLQRDRNVQKGCDICRLIDRRMTQWHEGQFDVLLQEVARCDCSFRNFHHSSRSASQDQLVRVFTKLMLEGNVRAAVRWLTEHSGWGVMKPSDFTEVRGWSWWV